MNCSSDLKIFENVKPSASNFKSFSQSLEQFFLTVGKNNFGNKIPFIFPLNADELFLFLQSQVSKTMKIDPLCFKSEVSGRNWTST